MKPQIAWAIARKARRPGMRDYIISTTCDINRKDAIDRFMKNFSHRTWKEMRSQGFFAVKIELVPVGGRS